MDRARRRAERIVPGTIRSAESDGNPSRRGTDRAWHYTTPAAIRVWESHFLLYRTIWKSNLMSAVVQPFLYLLGMGLGVGALVDRGADATQRLGGLTYLEFLAPALIATTAMMVASSESLWPVIAGFKWMRGYHAAAATPLNPGDIAGGVALWHFTKGLIAGSGVAIALLLFAETRSWGLPLAVVFAGLTGSAFSGPLSAWSATREQENSFPSIQRFVIMPLFLFGGAFYPIEELPVALQWIARVTPLWHGVELCRDAVNEQLAPGSTAIHVAYLAVFVAVGWALARRTFAKRLGG